MECLEPYNAIYLDNTDSGYKIQPCCLYNNTEGVVDSIDKIQAKNQELWPTLDWEKNCIVCLSKEKHNEHSKRLESFKSSSREKGLVRFDIRPGSTCNLKCIMCNPRNSSAWQQDIELWTKYNNDYERSLSRKNFNELDWDWIYTKCVDKAELIYIVGGEPFYMKSVHEFLNKLSKNQWNCYNTRILIQTNGVSNTPKFLDILSRFKKLEFSLSIDGWGEVNELIRFPTNHNTFIKNANELFQLAPFDSYFNITVQCMNLPNIDELVSNIKNRWNAKYEIHLLVGPDHLRIDNLKPHIIEHILETTQVFELKDFCNNYRYNDNLNKIMQKYLLDIDLVRGTDSRSIVPWCYV